MSFPRSKPLVAILGGSFDPITDAHLKAACEIIHSKCADEVWITPCGARPDKPSLKTSALDRLIMCHLAVDTMFGSKFPSCSVKCPEFCEVFDASTCWWAKWR